MSQQISYQISVQMETEACYFCQVLFAITMDFKQKRVADKQTFYCPSGHGQVYAGKSLEQVAKDETLRVQSLLNAEKHARLVAEKARDDAEAKTAAITSRVASGVCPCCNRTFANLARHMAGKHNDLVIVAGKKRRQIA